MTKHLRKISWTGLALMMVGATGVGHGAWIMAKAELAQVLLEWAWHRVENGDAEAAPWPWADTWPVARLEAPGNGVNLIVLAGASGAVLAFGPGHLPGTAHPGDPGHSMIAGHRDTHFEFLRDLKAEDEIVLTTPARGKISYRVERVWIADESDASVFESGPGESLTLVTCFPFDAIEAGGSLRYLVRARQESSHGEGQPSGPPVDQDETFLRLARLYK